ncbi:hypothetical protein LguiB_007624 [Lonicera macranthoides]
MSMLRRISTIAKLTPYSSIIPPYIVTKVQKVPSPFSSKFYSSNSQKRPLDDIGLICCGLKLEEFQQKNEEANEKNEKNKDEEEENEKNEETGVECLWTAWGNVWEKFSLDVKDYACMSKRDFDSLITISSELKTYADVLEKKDKENPKGGGNAGEKKEEEKKGEEYKKDEKKGEEEKKDENKGEEEKKDGKKGGEKKEDKQEGYEKNGGEKELEERLEEFQKKKEEKQNENEEANEKKRRIKMRRMRRMKRLRLMVKKMSLTKSLMSLCPVSSPEYEVKLTVVLCDIATKGLWTAWRNVWEKFSLDVKDYACMSKRDFDSLITVSSELKTYADVLEKKEKENPKGGGKAGEKKDEEKKGEEEKKDEKKGEEEKKDGKKGGE